MEFSVFCRMAVSSLLVAACSAAPRPAPFGGVRLGGARFDVGAFHPDLAAGGFVGRFGGPAADGGVLRGGVESEGFRRVGSGIDSARWDEAARPVFEVPDSGRQAIGPHDIGVQEVGPAEAIRRIIGQHEVGTQDIGRQEVGLQEIGLPDISGLEVGSLEAGPEEAGPKEAGPIDESGDESAVIGFNFAPRYHRSGIPWRNCISAKDPRCQQPDFHPFPRWSLFY